MKARMRIYQARILRFGPRFGAQRFAFWVLRVEAPKYMPGSPLDCFFPRAPAKGSS